jgi:DNA-binding transcriptional LysR family regulator
VAIGWRHLVDELLDQGLLCRVCAGEARSDFGYYVVLPERKRRQRLTQYFVDWLKLELAREDETVCSIPPNGPNPAF